MSGFTQQFRTPADYTPPSRNHEESREMPYNRPIVGLAKLWMRWMQRLEIIVEGSEKLPVDGGAMLAVNHTGYWDFVYGGIPAHINGERLVRFMAKKEIFDAPVAGTIMRAIRCIPVDRADGQASVDEAIRRLNNGELVGIFPEATISRSFEIKEFRQGAAKIAHEASAPLIPLTIWGSQRIWTKGRKPVWRPKNAKLVIVVGDPIEVTPDSAATTDVLYDTMVKQLDYTRSVYEKNFGEMPQGEFWVPSKLGGSAPTLEDATAQDRKDQQARKDKRAAELRQREIDEARRAEELAQATGLGRVIVKLRHAREKRK